MKPDPKRRKDGLCVVCLQPIKEPKGKWARAAAAVDSFCSTTCCRRYFDFELDRLDERLKESA